MRLSKKSQELITQAVSISEEWHLKEINTLTIISALIETPKFRRILSEASKLSIHEVQSQLEHTLSQKKQDPEEFEKESAQEVLEIFGDSDIPFKPEQLFSNAVIIFLAYAKLIADEERRTEIDVDDIVISMLVNEPRNLISLFKNTSTDIEKIKELYRYGKNKFKLPDSISQFVTILNDKFKNTDCAILGRDREVKQIWQTLQKKTKKNVILLGKPGTGKSSIVYKLAYDIVNYRCPPDFENTIVLSLDVNSLIAGTSLRGEAEERYKDIINFVQQNKNVILFIDEIHMIVGAGACSGKDNQDFSNALKPLLAGDDSMIIGATTMEEYNKSFGNQGALRRRFRNILVREPKSTEVYPMLKDSIKQLADFHGVTISREMVDFIILNSSCFHYETANPDRTKDLIDLSMATAKMAGKKRVDKKSVLTNFSANFEKFRKMSLEKIKTVAYHEIGHYLVWRFSGRLVDEQVIAISIVPAENYLGVNVFDKTDEVVTDDMNYFIDKIAMCLAGRVSEKMFTDSYTSGAASDLREATKMAYDVVARYGMAEFGENRVFINEKGYCMQTEKTVNSINHEIDSIIQKAYQRAENILKMHRKVQEALVEILCKKGILNKKELDEVVSAFNRDTVKII